VHSGARYRLLAFLTPLTVSRIGVALGGGAAFAVACLMWGVTTGAGVSSQLVIGILAPDDQNPPPDDDVHPVDG
jgi:hypothetical protein